MKVSKTTWKRVVLIAIPGLTMEDARQVDLGIAEARLFSHIWTTSLHERSALTSLMTGLYPHTHQVLRPGDRLNADTPTMAQRMAHTGRHVQAVLGTIPFAPTDPLWAGFQDIRTASKDTFLPHAGVILAETQQALDGATPENPSFSFALLGDLKRPYLPRADAWKRHWPEGKTTPWSLSDSRKNFSRLAEYDGQPSADVAAFVQALRLGKVEEVFSALRSFVGEARQRHPSETAVIVVGLGRPRSPAFFSSEPASAHVPLWLIGPPMSSKSLQTTADLTDVASTVITIAGADSERFGQGRQVAVGATRGWSEAAFTRLDQGTHYIAMGERVLRVNRSTVTPILYRQILRPFPGAPYEPVTGALQSELIWMELMGRHLEAWHAAGASWHEDDFSVSTRRSQQKVKYGYDTTCRQ